MQYAYDAIGNRTQKTVDGVAQQYSYGSTSQHLQSVGTTSFSYDAVGNTTSQGQFSYVYNQANRLSEVHKGNRLYSNQYNALGQRLFKNYQAATSTDTVFHYDQSGKLIAESGTNGGVIREYVYLGELLTVQYGYANQNIPLTLSGSIGTALNVEGYIYVVADHLGTPQLTMNKGANGGVHWAVDYLPFGSTLKVAGDSANYPIRFPGQYEDDPTPNNAVNEGLHYNYFRDYDPEVGRYVQSDPIGLEGGVNTYGYVLNDPINLVDPLGLEPNILGVSTSQYPTLSHLAGQPPSIVNAVLNAPSLEQQQLNQAMGKVLATSAVVATSVVAPQALPVLRQVASQSYLILGVMAPTDAKIYTAGIDLISSMITGPVALNGSGAVGFFYSMYFGPLEEFCR